MIEVLDHINQTSHILAAGSSALKRTQDDQVMLSLQREKFYVGITTNSDVFIFWRK